jgi:hypothetical protein
MVEIESRYYNTLRNSGWRGGFGAYQIISCSILTLSELSSGVILYGMAMYEMMPEL